MTVYMGIDLDNGVAFNSRPQSRDRIAREHMLEHCKNSTLWICDYSTDIINAAVAEKYNLTVMVDEDFLTKAGPNDHCFVENRGIDAYIDRVDTLVLFKWHMRYLADTYFDTSILKNGWKKTETHKFSGSSHDLITKEVWKHA